MHDSAQLPARAAFSMDEAARSLGLSVSTVKVLIGQGRLRATKIGRRVLIPAAELDRLLVAN